VKKCHNYTNKYVSSYTHTSYTKKNQSSLTKTLHMPLKLPSILRLLYLYKEHFKSVPVVVIFGMYVIYCWCRCCRWCRWFNKRTFIIDLTLQ